MMPNIALLGNLCAVRCWYGGGHGIRQQRGKRCATSSTTSHGSGCELRRADEVGEMISKALQLGLSCVDAYSYHVCVGLLRQNVSTPTSFYHVTHFVHGVWVCSQVSARQRYVGSCCNG
eukprot:m.56330 g.56330  ORF g.56330 m.56330 type:complete len:119 (+) comp11555_c0_seq2:768-1124(+)